MEHQRPDDAEEEAEQGKSDDPPDKGCEAEPEHGPIGVQGCREHPVRSGPSKARDTTRGLVGYLGIGKWSLFQNWFKEKPEHKWKAGEKTKGWGRSGRDRHGHP